MANVKAKRHTHKYYKAYEFKDTGPFLWACALPTCSHHMPKHMESMLPGKYTLCWKCEETTVLDTRTMKMDKPLCEDCDTNYISIESPDLLEELVKAGLVKDGEKS